MNINESPYQRLIEIIDVILVKNEAAQSDQISIHLAEIPSLPLIAPSADVLHDFLRTLKKRGLITDVKYVNLLYYIPKLSKAAEKKLIAERKNLFDKAQGRTVKNNEKLSLKGQEIIFNDDEVAILVGKRKCALPPFKNEHFFCRAMFLYLPNEPVDWSIIYKKMDDRAEDIPDKKYSRTVQDTAYAINDRIKEVINTDDKLFTWENKTVKRNF